MKLPKDADKVSLRQWAKEYRASLSSQDLAEASQKLRSQLATWQPYQGAQHILLYAPTASELNLLPLAKDGSKHFYLTRTWKNHRCLTLHAFGADSVLEQHRYGYQQPMKDSLQVPTESIDMVLVPGLVFDKQGGRLGYGGGYYDRLLAKMPRAILVATLVDALLLDAFPDGIIESHDVAMHYVVSNARVLPCSPLHNPCKL